MNEPDEFRGVPAPPPPLPQIPESGSLGVLGYAPPAVRRVSPVWAKIAIVTALVYAGFTLFVAILAAIANTDGDRLTIYVPLLLTSPLGIIALVTGILGHYSPRGRVNAGPAVWIVACTPAGSTAINLLVDYLAQRATRPLLPLAGTIIGVNVLLILVLNGRILKASSIERKYNRQF